MVYSTPSSLKRMSPPSPPCPRPTPVQAIQRLPLGMITPASSKQRQRPRVGMGVRMLPKIGAVCQLSSKGRWAGVEWYVVLDGFVVF